MRVDTSIPIIDLDDSEQQILLTLERAFADTGFVLVRGHGVANELVTRMRGHLIQYFDRPVVEKLTERITPDNYRGYIPLGFFSPNSQGVMPDHYEGYKLHTEIAPDDPIRGACDLYGPNRWPHNPAGLREATEAFWQACEATGQRLLGLVAQIMKVDVADFLALFDQPLTNMTLMHYPPCGKEDRFGIHPHKDTDALTLLFPDEIGGLWLRPRDQSAWMEVKAPPNTLVVNIGDLLELWSGGHFISTPHKVVNTSGKDRYSFPFFIVPRHDVVVEPLIPCQPGFKRNSVPVGPASREVWRTNWPGTVPEDTGFDLGTLPD